MKNIIDYLEYDGASDLAVNVMYTGGPFEINGTYDLEVYGKGRINQHPVEGRVRGSGDIKLTIQKGSAVVFWQLPVKADTPGGFMPVPDLPDVEDQFAQELEHYIEQALQRRGLGGQDGPPHPRTDAKPEFDDDDEDGFYEDWEGPPLDTHSLIADPYHEQKKPEKSDSEPDESRDAAVDLSDGSVSNDSGGRPDSGAETAASAPESEPNVQKDVKSLKLDDDGYPASHR